MVIKYENILLRAIELKDADLLRSMINDEHIEKMIWGNSFPVSEHQQSAWIKNLPNDNSTFRSMIEVNGDAIGTIILNNIDMKNGNAEIHIKIANACQRGKGYGTNAVKALVEYAFNELRLNCVYCKVKEDNLLSKKMFEKCGFIQEGLLRSRVYHCGKYYDFFQYSILKMDLKK